ncbi:Carbohydrate/purine kinase domain protein [Rhodopirellula sallentina SM41]|uniref:Carbohydrate/purine kinase domain protein n=1 Tax=Rhodopirellula sallentina SM41 TaxID=1263870 RepID=M5UI27_9BACT|nr:Carbohydrate/purine kinase domain protein [Rhodopirellula sallentina SM41]
MGGDGVLVIDDSGLQPIAPQKVDAVDTTGAGDSFTGALAVSLSEGLSLVEAANNASIVAAISVTRMGTQTSFPTQQEVRQWLAK